MPPLPTPRPLGLGWHSSPAAATSSAPLQLHYPCAARALWVSLGPDAKAPHANWHDLRFGLACLLLSPLLLLSRQVLISLSRQRRMPCARALATAAARPGLVWWNDGFVAAAFARSGVPRRAEVCGTERWRRHSGYFQVVARRHLVDVHGPRHHGLVHERNAAGARNGRERSRRPHPWGRVALSRSTRSRGSWL